MPQDPLRELTEEILAFRNARDWAQFHTIKNLAASLSIEAAELLEILQWTEGPDAETAARERRDDLQDELADVAVYMLLIAHHLDIDLPEAIRHKLAKNAQKYPVAKAKGSAKKYTAYE